MLREHDNGAAAAEPEFGSGTAELAAVLARLPADARPGPPTVAAYDELLPSRRPGTTAGAPNPTTPRSAAQGLRHIRCFFGGYYWNLLESD
ncbi:hypothetical protein [Nocardia fluminea]|uniref:hypothetical protein n=1 Tax=Nocardia fluminea TaxID=134984 RepID=UPI003438B9C2